MVAQEPAQVVGEPIELGRKTQRGILEELGRRAQAGRKSPDVQHAALDPPMQRVRQALGQLVEPLGGMTQQDERVRQAARQPDQPMLQLAEVPLHAVEHAVVELSEPMRELGADRHHEFRGGRGRGRPPVGGMVDQRRVGLVADRRDQGNAAGRRGAHHDLLVEGPQVLERAAAARHDQDVRARHRAGLGQGVEAGDRGRDLLGGELALHRDRPQQNPARKALGQAVQHVADHRAAWRGHDPDHLRQERQALLARDVEQPLCGELLLALLEQSHERADASRREPVDDQLVLRAARIGGDAAGRHDLEAVLRFERQAQRRAAPAHGVEAGGVVLEREVAVAGGVLLEPRDLAAHPNVAVAVLERAFERRRQLADGILGDVQAFQGRFEAHVCSNPDPVWHRGRGAADPAG